MTTSKYLTLSFLLACFAISAQTGYLGSKNSLSLTVFGNKPIIGQDNSLQQYQLKGDKMVATKEQVNYGYGVEYMRVFSKRFAIGIELNQKSVSLTSPNYFVVTSATDDILFSDTVYYRSSPLKFNLTSPSLRFEFYSKEGVGNIGIVHSFSIGATIAQVQKKAYAYSLNEFGSGESEEALWTKPENYYLEQEWGKFYGINGGYSIFLRYPVSDHFSLNFGLKTMLNVYLKPSEENRLNKNNPPYSLDESYFTIQKETLINLHLKAGLTYHF